MDYIDYPQLDEYNEFDAFNEGVEPGGLRNRNEIKILVCYVLKTLESTITKQQINEVMQSQGLANYFEVNQAISELLSQGSIDCDYVEDKENLTVTEMGRRVAFELERDLPRTVREKAIKSAIKILTIAKNEQENKIEITPLENGCHITFIMEDKQDVMMKLTIYVADRAQAELVRKNFLEDPTRVYSNILSSLVVE
ncbi:MAG: DUF4364 family protein [Clostridia bacterium]|nr:DUF4364 family protein [Clostridia bacterium]